jgi:hypothetical protein
MPSDLIIILSRRFLQRHFATYLLYNFFTPYGSAAGAGGLFGTSIPFEPWQYYRV